MELRRRLLTGVFLFLVICGITVSGQNGPSELKKVTVVCQWLPQAQFAGFYMAKLKGFYNKYGLDVTIGHAGTTASNTKMLRSGKAQFISMFLASAIRERSEGMKLVNIAQLLQKSSLLLVGRKADGINSVKDLNGKRIGIWRSDFRDIPLKFLKRNGINCKVVLIRSGINMYLWGGVDVLTVTSYNELHSLMMAGIKLKDLTLFKMSDYALDIPEDGLYCMDKYYRDNKELCHNFVRATEEGWKYAFNHPDETLETVAKLLREHRLPMTRTHQKWMLQSVRELMLPDGDHLNFGLSREKYYRTAEILKASGRIKTIPRYEDFYKGK